MLTSSAHLMWRTQEILHRKNSPVVPVGMMLLASSLVVYRHVYTETMEEDHLKTFLAMILVQMLPLVALEMKIMSCADPVGLFCKFAAPVTLLHGIFLLMRVIQYPLYQQGNLMFAIMGVLGAGFTMQCGYRQRWSGIFQYTSVWSLLALAVLAACCTESIDDMFSPAWRVRSWEKYIAAVLATSNSYIELMAFVPAVWMVYRESDSQGFHVESSITKRVSTAFFLFLVIFYSTEDLWQAWSALYVAPIAAIAHVAHFLLLLDFAFYVLAHVYNPEKLMGELRKWLPADLACAV